MSASIATVAIEVFYFEKSSSEATEVLKRKSVTVSNSSKIALFATNRVLNLVPGVFDFTSVGLGVCARPNAQPIQRVVKRSRVVSAEKTKSKRRLELTYFDLGKKELPEECARLVHMTSSGIKLEVAISNLLKECEFSAEQAEANEDAKLAWRQEMSGVPWEDRSIKIMF